MRILVAGGGILGCSAALALAQAGHAVTLRTQGHLGEGASSKAAGIVSTMTWNDDDLRLIARTRGLVGEMVGLAMSEGCREARGAWRKAESIMVSGQADAGVLDAVQERLERHTEEPERLSALEAARQFPMLRFAPGEEVLVAQEDGVLESGDLFAALRARLDAEGVAVEERQPVAVPREGLPAGVEALVVAGGAWTVPLLRTAGVLLPALPYRVQLASVGLAAGGETPIVHDLVHHFYARPESPRTILAGDGTELRPFDPSDYNEAGDGWFVERLAASLVERFVEGGDATVRSSWAGLVVGTPDRRPLCGPVPGRDGLFVLTGDNGFGLMRGLALGERLADAVAGRTHPATDPARFGWPPPTDFP
ncbi:MAG TPA: FAD-binding oxidoreductase, partial [Candidatus Thermoplasmatota archaeon]|nr:FAD-binding oxidoreductase [Candidatus Thermoplasmatota archaeon]